MTKLTAYMHTYFELGKIYGHPPKLYCIMKGRPVDPILQNIIADDYNKTK